MPAGGNRAYQLPTIDALIGWGIASSGVANYAYFRAHITVSKVVLHLQVGMLEASRRGQRRRSICGRDAGQGSNLVIDSAALYRESRERIAAFVRSTTEEQRAVVVPGCPEWTVSDTVAHLAGVAVDIVAGYSVATISTDEHTANQVKQRRGRSLEEVLAEWESVAEGVERITAAQTLPIELVSDVLSHEADIRGALGAGRPPKAAWMAALNLGRPRLTKRLGHLGELTIIDGEDCITVGSGKPATIVEVDLYEFWRSALGRRSRKQMTAWKWSGDFEPYLQAIPVLGPTQMALSEPP